MTNDLIAMAMREAVRVTVPADGTFSAESFQAALCRYAGVTSGLNPRMVEAILVGRDDVVMLSDGLFGYTGWEQEGNTNGRG